MALLACSHLIHFLTCVHVHCIIGNLSVTGITLHNLLWKMPKHEPVSTVVSGVQYAIPWSHFMLLLKLNEYDILIPVIDWFI